MATTKIRRETKVLGIEKNKEKATPEPSFIK